MAVLHLTEDTFDKATERGVALVDFWADWCRPCKLVAPVIEELADEYGDRALVGKVDVDACNALAGRFGIMSIPTVMLFRDGAEVKRFIGVQPKEEYKTAIAALVTARP
jgi:thioredoxin 1